MNILITGYGRMGMEVETILTGRGHTIAGIIDPRGGEGIHTRLSAEITGEADCVIDFSFPGTITDNIHFYIDNKIPAIIGTTGWEQERDAIREKVEQSKSTLLWSSNFAMGTNLFFGLVRKAAGMIKGIPEFDIMVNEYHHKMKQDSPSGTALRIADCILESNPRKTEIVTNRLDRAIEEHELHIGSVRGGMIPGIHTVTLDSAAETIELIHSTRNRSGLALGAVMAAEWLEGKTGFFSGSDYIDQLFEGDN